MFGVLYITEDGYRQFEILDTQDEARRRAIDMTTMSGGAADATVFDYDANTNTYIEFYKV